MSSRDRTRQKLVGSMRKTKSDIGGGKEPVETESAANGQESSTPAKAANRSGTRRASSRQPESVDLDAYQSGGRVWPD